MNAFRVIRISFLETLNKRCLSSLASIPSSTTSAVPIQARQKIRVTLPLAAQERYQHTVSSSTKEQMSSWEKMKWDMGFYGKLRVSKSNLHVAGFRLYVCCTDLVDFAEFVKEVNIPDSFNGWYLVLQLHLWLLHVKLSHMGKEGLLLTQHLYKNMWLDVERRLNTYQELLGSEKAKAMRQFHSLMCSSILYYDEGLIGTDQQLANSLWLQLFSMDENVGAKHLELMVEYVRKQIHHLDGLKDDLIMKPGYVSFLPLYGTRLDDGKKAKDLEYLQTIRY